MKIYKTFDEFKDKVLYNLPLDNQGIYEEVNKQNRYGLFQMSGFAYSRIADQIKPVNFDELNACNALSRPGTISFTDDYINGKNGIQKYNSNLNSILNDTHNIFLYQEQIMLTFAKIGGFSLDEADSVRSLMKKLSKKDKKPEDILKWEKTIEKFTEGAKKLNISDEEINLIKDDLLKFSEYSFNKCVSGKCIIDGYNENIETLFSSCNYTEGYSLDYNTKSIVKNTIKNIYFSGKRDIYKIILKNDYSIKVTSNHKFPCKSSQDFCEKSIQSGLRVGDFLFVNTYDTYNTYDNENCHIFEIVSIIYIGEEDVYDIEMKAPYHTVFVNNIAMKNSHCSSYSYIGALTAFLANYFREEFYCSCINAALNTDEILQGISACKKENIIILPPNINESKFNFSVKDDKTLLFGLNGIKYVGEKAIELIIQNRPYSSFDDFLSREELKNRSINKRTIVALISAGCFDIFNKNRKQLIYIYESKKENIFSEDISNNIITNENDYFEFEKEYLGYNLYYSKFSNFVLEKINKISHYNYIEEISNETKYIALMLKDIQPYKDKNKNDMAFLTFEDNLGNSTRIALFASIYSIFKNSLITNDVYFVFCRRTDKGINLGLPGFVKNETTIKKYLINASQKERETIK